MYFHHYKQKDVSRAGGLIFNKSRTKVVLVLNRISYLKGEYKFGLPKGHLYPYESIAPFVGAQREIWEETGVFFPVNQFLHSFKIYDTRYYTLELNSDIVSTFHPTDQNEIIYAGWFDIEAVKYLNVNRTLSKISKNWKKFTSVHTQNDGNI
jgi:8-oxo-dGTP pyrophosphatase MutT (NUDIX family)